VWRWRRGSGPDPPRVGSHARERTRYGLVYDEKGWLSRAWLFLEYWLDHGHTGSFGRNSWNTSDCAWVRTMESFTTTIRARLGPRAGTGPGWFHRSEVATKRPWLCPHD